jgi:hypothetical protein
MRRLVQLWLDLVEVAEKLRSENVLDLLPFYEFEVQHTLKAGVKSAIFLLPQGNKNTSSHVVFGCRESN